MRRLLKQVSVLLVGWALVFGSTVPTAQAQQNPPSNQSFVGGKFVARQYAYPGVTIAPGVNNPAGVATITLHTGQVRLQDGRTIVPFSAGGQNILGNPGPTAAPAIPIYVGAGTTRELVTPTAVSGCFIGAPQDISCKITATFANAHGTGELVTSGSFGIQEAINDAIFWGGGVVSVDPSENFYAGSAQTITTAMAAANVVPGVCLEDDRTGQPTLWEPLAGATTLAAPATLTAVTALPSTTPVGTFTATAYNMCIAYVDILGQEGPCSTSFVNTGAGATSSFIFSAPAASPGAVGYTIYIGLTAAGSTTLQYKVPLVLQPTVVGAYPLTNGVCAALTTVELVTPACAVANTTFNQVGSTATVTAITLSTSPIQPESTTTSSTTVYVPNPGGRTTYTYAPTAGLGAPGGMPSAWLPFVIGAAAATTVPNVVATINLPPQFANVLGRKFQICGDMTTTASTATIVDIQFQYDAMGIDTAGKGVLIGDETATVTALVTAGHATFCQDFMTTVTSAAVTGGSINHTNSYGGVAGLTAVAGGVLADAMTGATNGGTALLNLALDSRINIIYLHQTATDGAGWTMQHLTIKQI
jgi:hypothetical protein